MNRLKFAVPATAVLAALAIHAVAMSAAPPPDDDQTITHVLNRIAFGPRPGDIERVRQLGVRQYIEQQLHPERIADAAVAVRLNGFSTLNLSSKDIAERYEIPAMEAKRDAKQEAARAP